MDDWYLLAFDLIDLRSFSNMWFWITLAYTWSMTSHFVMGVPYDMVARAQRIGGDAEQDLKDIVRINVRRINYIVEHGGAWLVGMVFFALVSLMIMGFVYGVEICQALFLIFLPLSVVFTLTIRCARQIDHRDLGDIESRLRRQRVITQFIGMFSIFVTSMWGMFYNATSNVLGG